MPTLPISSWIAAGVTDMRRGFHELSAQVQTVLERQPLSGHVFVFRGRRGDIVKVLWFDGDGIVSAGQEARTPTLCAAAGNEWRLLTALSLEFPRIFVAATAAATKVWVGPYSSPSYPAGVEKLTPLSG